MINIAPLPSIPQAYREIIKSMLVDDQLSDEQRQKINSDYIPTLKILEEHYPC